MFVAPGVVRRHYRWRSVANLYAGKGAPVTARPADLDICRPFWETSRPRAADLAFAGRPSNDGIATDFS
jgi:hypothetical protein